MTSDVAEKIEKFFTKYPHRSYPKGHILLFADENPEHIFYLVKGKMREYDVTHNGDEVIVNIFKPPSFFPMSWAVNQAENKYFYKAEEATELHLVPAKDALEFIKTNPDVMLDLLSRVYHGTVGLQGRMVHLMSGRAKSRLIYELIIESRRFGEKDKSGTYVVDVSEVDLAARSGLSRETVSREMRKLKDQGLVRLDRGSIIIKDLKVLEEILGAEI